MNYNVSEIAHSVAITGAGIGRNVGAAEQAHAHGHFVAQCIGPVEKHRARYVALRERIAAVKNGGAIAKLMHGWRVPAMKRELAGIPTEVKWADTFKNAVVPEGKNYILDKGFAGSSYTAAWYVGIYNSGYSVVGTETYAAKGGTENTNYSNSTRPATSWSAASAGSKALSSAAAFNINGAGGTIAGCFVANVSTKGDSTASAGVNAMWSIGAFTGGNKTVASGDTLNVSYTTGL